ncbi:lectin-like [Ostrea edulis]|uniref:lectin-like n=1 Tax=Ostrea edulis TaxID=37623 RepID=UPI0024AF907F|nr:lectin-like [Ostrea edulis]
MEWRFLAAVKLIHAVVHADIISEFMSRDPTYDDRATSATNVMDQKELKSFLRCASYCTRTSECKSVMYNSRTHFCQVLSVYLDSGSDIGPQTSTGWNYYLRKIGIQTTESVISTTTSVAMTTALDIHTTESVISTTTSVDMTTPFDCSIWHPYNGHWYRLDTIQRSFTQSQTFCQVLFSNAYVIEVESQGENDWLLSLTATHCGNPHEYWLNGYDNDDSGSFTWLHGGTISSYKNWYGGEPSESTEKCIVSSTGYLGVWNDISCSERRPVVCERDN